MKQHIIVIGSGFGGLAAAIRLRAQGHDVTLFERQDKLGGRAYVIEQDGFKFDAGPTVLTAPWMIHELFGLAGRRTEDYVEMVKINPFYRLFDHQGRHLDYNSDHQFILDEIARFSEADRAGYDRFIRSTEAVFNTGMPLIDQPFLHFSDMLRAAPDLIRLQSYRSVYGYVSGYLENDFLRRAFSFHPLLIGGNPLSASSLYVLIHHLEREWGIHYAMGGTGALVAALGRLLEELGVRVHLNSTVSEILVDATQRRVTGVRLEDGSSHHADSVVSNGDLAWTYLHLIDKRHRRINSNAWVRSKKYSMSLFVLYLGVKRRYSQPGTATGDRLAHHNIIFSEDYKGLLREIFGSAGLPDDFSLYLHMPGKTDPLLAPPGCESLYVLSPVPNLKADIDWQQQAKPYRDRIVRFLQQNYLPDLEENIVVEKHIDPLHFQNRLLSYVGSAFSVQPVLWQSAWFRPHNRSEDFANLYFVGAGTHPGAGLPGVLASGKIAAELIG
ncbi:MAG: phytoene desaturase [Caldilineales bacterium]